MLCKFGQPLPPVVGGFVLLGVWIQPRQTGSNELAHASQRRRRFAAIYPARFLDARRRALNDLASSATASGPMYLRCSPRARVLFVNVVGVIGGGRMKRILRHDEPQVEIVAHGCGGFARWHNGHAQEKQYGFHVSKRNVVVLHAVLNLRSRILNRAGRFRPAGLARRLPLLLACWRFLPVVIERIQRQKPDHSGDTGMASILSEIRPCSSVKATPHCR